MMDRCMLNINWVMSQHKLTKLQLLASVDEIAHMRRILSFAGVGSLGRPVLSKLLKNPLAQTNFIVDLHTADKVASEFQRQFPTVTCSAQESVGIDSEVIITCLPSSKEVRSVAEDFMKRVNRATQADAIQDAYRLPRVWIDITSGDPLESRELSALLLKSTNTHFFDVGVSGGKIGAEKGTLTAMVGADSTDVFEQQVLPILKAFCHRVVHVGPSGSGHAVKAVNNALLAANLCSATEGLLALTQFGVSPELAASVISDSSGSSKVTSSRMPEYILTRKFDYGFSLGLHCKDVDTAVRFIGNASISAADTHSVAPVLTLTQQVMHAARDYLGDAADHVEVVKYIEKRSGGNTVLSFRNDSSPTKKKVDATSTPASTHLPPVPTSLLTDRGIQLVVCDMAGTTVDEGGLIYQLLREAINWGISKTLNQQNSTSIGHNSGHSHSDSNLSQVRGGHRLRTGRTALLTDSDIDSFHGAQKLAVIRHFVNEFFPPTEEPSSSPSSVAAGVNVSSNESAVGAEISSLSDEERRKLVSEIDTYLDESLAAAYFDPLRNNLSLVQPSALPHWLKEVRAKGIKVALNTGYSKSIQTAIVEKLGLNDLVDGYIASSEVPKGRPSPYMVHTLMQRFQVEDVKRVAKVGDTVNDILEGRNAGCGVVIGVLSGADSAEKLLAAGADFVVSSCVDITI